MYLQVVAAAQPQAGVVVDTLKQKGFPALLAHGPNATLFRVMVGPFADAATLGKAKADLESAGFHPLVRK
jgi:cell division septation protein DedD